MTWRHSSGSWIVAQGAERNGGGSSTVSNQATSWASSSAVRLATLARGLRQGGASQGGP